MSLNESESATLPPDLRRIVDQPIRVALGGIVLGYPTNFHKHGPMAMLGPRVAITMFESTKLPPGWVENLNLCGAVIVPSSFCKRLFEDEGVTVPVHVIPLGVDEAYAPVLRDAEAEPFTFLAFADRGRRKGSHEATQAFIRAFGDDPRYRLLVKMRERDTKINILNPNIDMVQADMSTEELYGLYQQAHCLVFAAKGEGFGLPPREFAASGGVVIATTWSGLADHIVDYAWPLGYEMGPAWKGHRDFEALGLGEWAEPDVDDLAGLMRWIADNRHAVTRWAFKGADRVHELYQWDEFADSVYEVWQDATRSKVYGFGSAKSGTAR
jgi:glycosyltransferase involved in cell wall biosynthesis